MRKCVCFLCLTNPSWRMRLSLIVLRWWEWWACIMRHWNSWGRLIHRHWNWDRWTIITVLSGLIMVGWPIIRPMRRKNRSIWRRQTFIVILFWQQRVREWTEISYWRRSTWWQANRIVHWLSWMGCWRRILMSGRRHTSIIRCPRCMMWLRIWINRFIIWLWLLWLICSLLLKSMRLCRNWLN